MPNEKRVQLKAIHRKGPKRFQARATSVVPLRVRVPSQHQFRAGAALKAEFVAAEAVPPPQGYRESTNMEGSEITTSTSRRRGGISSMEDSAAIRQNPWALYNGGCSNFDS